MSGTLRWSDVANALVDPLHNANQRGHVVLAALERLLTAWGNRWQSEPPTEHEAALLRAVALTYARDLLPSFPSDLHPPYPMGLIGRDLQLYEVGFLAGFALSQESARADIQRIHDEADRLYLIAFPEESEKRQTAVEEALSVMPHEPAHTKKGTS